MCLCGISCSSPIVRMGLKPLTRGFATRFYDSPLYQAMKKEYESASEAQEKGITRLLL